MSGEQPLSGVERIKQQSDGLRGQLAAELAQRTTHVSDESAQLLKFHGTYQQEDRDRRRAQRGTDAEPAHQFMVRCKIPGGVLSGPQYLVIDELADRYGNGTLRVTTRQGNQFHGVLKGDLKATIRAVNDALVTTLGACGDVVRNVVSCPAPLSGGLREQVLSVARRLSDHLLPRTGAYHEIWLDGEQVAGGPPESEPIYGTRYLPRKFKVAFAFPDDNCCDVHSNDLGFLVVQEGGQLLGCNVLVGGGMGKTHGKEDTYPRLADMLGFAATEQVVEVAEAVVKVQRDHGNRGDRRHARLKYLLDRKGSTGSASRWSASWVVGSRRPPTSKSRASPITSGGTRSSAGARSWACSSRTGAFETTVTGACAARFAASSRRSARAYASRRSRIS